VNTSPACTFGANVKPYGVAFRVWAPRAKKVVLELCSPPFLLLPMNKESGGFFSLACTDAAAGTHYQLRIDGRVVPDPASRFQPCDVYGPSEVVDPGQWRWRDDSWQGRPWHEAVIYELHVGAFSEQGDYAGVIQQLDRLQRLGITAIELMPLADFPGRFNWGYDGVLWYAPDHRYGRPEQLQAFLDAAHDRGLMVFLDVVYNHFGPEGNFLFHYARFLRRGCHTPWGDCIAIDRAAVRRFIIENVLYWLKSYHLDGLRFDAVQYLIADGDRPLLADIAESVSESVTDRHVHLMLENDDNRVDYLTHGYRAQWNDDFHHACHVLLTGEQFGYYQDYPNPLPALAKSLSQGFVYQGQVSAFRGRARGQDSRSLSPLSFIHYLQNHDQVGNRPQSQRLSRSELLLGLTAVLCLAPAVPLFFMGQEWGADQPFPFFSDLSPCFRDIAQRGRLHEMAALTGISARMLKKHVALPWRGQTFTQAKLDPPDQEQQAWLRAIRTMLHLRHTHIIPLLAESEPHSHYRCQDDRLSVHWCWPSQCLEICICGSAIAAKPPAHWHTLLYPLPGMKPCKPWSIFAGLYTVA